MWRCAMLCSVFLCWTVHCFCGSRSHRRTAPLPLVSSSSKDNNSPRRCTIDSAPHTETTLSSGGVVDRQPLCYARRTAVAAGIDIRDTPTMGLGAFATRPMANGTYVGEYSGELVTDYETETRYRGKHTLLASDVAWRTSRMARGQTMTGHYLFDMGQGVSVDAEDTDRSGWCRYMNHHRSDDASERDGNVDDCSRSECNVRPSNYKVNGIAVHKPRFFAIRDIDAGEELKYDYGDTFWDNQQAE